MAQAISRGTRLETLRMTNWPNEGRWTRGKFESDPEILMAMKETPNAIRTLALTLVEPDPALLSNALVDFLSSPNCHVVDFELDGSMFDREE